MTVGEFALAEEEGAIVWRQEDVARAELVEVAREDEAAEAAWRAARCWAIFSTVVSGRGSAVVF
jgi:hypothetical protein